MYRSRCISTWAKRISTGRSCRTTYSGTSRIITAATANSFKEQIRMEDDIYVTTTVAKVGNKSITLFQQIIGRNAAGRETVKTESTSVMVAFDFDRQESVTVPERWRRNLAD